MLAAIILNLKKIRFSMWSDLKSLTTFVYYAQFLAENINDNIVLLKHEKRC